MPSRGVSMKATVCIVCRTSPAVVPDRDSGSLRVRLCWKCHAEKLSADLREISRLNANARRKDGDDAQ